MVTFAINTHFIRKRPLQTVLSVLGLSGVVLVFLPFVHGEVPVDVFFENSEDLNLFRAVLVGPCVVLPFFISTGYLRWLSTGAFSRWEGRLDYALALSVVVLFSFLILQTWWQSGFDDDFLVIAFLTLGLGAGAWFVIQNLCSGAPHTLTPLVALQVAYLPFALFWLVLPVSALVDGHVSSINIGAYVTFLAAIIYTAQATLTVRSQPRRMLALLPLGVVWVSGLGWWTAGFLGGP